MQMYELDDNALLREYAEQNSEPAFAMLVARHVDKVYSVALRHTRNPHSAEEITQAVFVILAKKANKLHQHAVLSGWLYQTARLTAVTFIRSEIRRARREQEAYMQTSLNENESETWAQIAPLLDTALAGLSETDRNAVVLRFFDGKSMKEVGAALGASEDAAKMRLNRAVEKLRKFFTKRGIVLPAAVLTAAISANSVQAAPVALAKIVTAVAIAKGAAASGSTLTLTKGALKIMAWTKMKTAVVVGLGVLIVGSAGLIASKELLADKNNFEAEGYLDYGLSGRTHPFKVFISGDKWLIRTPINTNGILYSEESFDGKYNYNYTQLAGRGNSENSSMGSIEQDDIPAFNSTIVPIWLAYGASRFFDGVIGTKVKPFLMASGLRGDRDHLFDVEWQRSKKPPFVPTYIYCQEINYRYRVMQFTNLDGLFVPSEFAFETFPRGTGLTNAPNYFVHGFLTKITKPATIQDFRPKIDSHTYTEDWRFPRGESAKIQQATYMNTSKDWFSTNSPQWQALLKNWNWEAGAIVWPRNANINGVTP